MESYDKRSLFVKNLFQTTHGCISTTKTKLSTSNSIVMSKIPPLCEKRNSKGLKKCNMFNCNTCPFVSNQTSVKSSATNFSLVINQPVNCESENVIYCISNKSSCKYVQYIGETKRPLKKRFSDHCYYVKKPDLTQPIGFHFNLPGHSISNMKICIVEKCSQSSDLYRKQ